MKSKILITWDWGNFQVLRTTIKFYWQLKSSLKVEVILFLSKTTDKSSLLFKSDHFTLKND